MVDHHHHQTFYNGFVEFQRPSGYGIFIERVRAGYVCL